MEIPIALTILANGMEAVCFKKELYFVCCGIIMLYYPIMVRSYEVSVCFFSCYQGTAFSFDSLFPYTFFYIVISGNSYTIEIHQYKRILVIGGYIIRKLRYAFFVFFDYCQSFSAELEYLIISKGEDMLPICAEIHTAYIVAYQHIGCFFTRREGELVQSHRGILGTPTISYIKMVGIKMVGKWRSKTSINTVFKCCFPNDFCLHSKT